MNVAVDMMSVLNIVGGSLVAVIVWAALGIFKRLDSLEKLLAAETGQLRELYHSVDKRVQALEIGLPRPQRLTRAADPPQ